MLSIDCKSCHLLIVFEKLGSMGPKILFKKSFLHKILFDKDNQDIKILTKFRAFIDLDKSKFSQLNFKKSDNSQ